MATRASVDIATRVKDRMNTGSAALLWKSQIRKVSLQSDVDRSERHLDIDDNTAGDFMTDYSITRYADGPPRLFWRRGFAFIIDVVLFYVGVFLVLFAINVLSPWDIRFGALDYTECRPAPPSPLVAQVDSEWPLEFGLVRTNTLCRKTYLFDSTHYVFRSNTAKTKGLYTWSKWVAVASDENGVALAAEDMRSLLLAQGLIQGSMSAVVIGLFIYFTAGGRRTLGKRLLGLKVMTPYGISPGLHRAARRELLKFAPLIVSSLSSLLITLYTFWNPDYFSDLIAQVRDMRVTNLPLSIVLPVVFGIAQLFWWLWPFISWRGQTYYDRIVGCMVLRWDQSAPLSNRGAN